MTSASASDGVERLPGGTPARDTDDAVAGATGAATRPLSAVPSTDDVTLHVETHGPAGAPPVVLIHGWALGTSVWAPLIQALGNGHRVIMYDQRGHGRSTSPLHHPTTHATGFSTDALADDLCAVLTATLAPHERAVLVGHSLGGMAIMAAADRPELRRHATAALLCSTRIGRRSSVSALEFRRSRRLRARLRRKLLLSHRPLGPPTPMSRRVLRRWTMGTAATPEAARTVTRLVHACPRQVRAAWARVLDQLDLRTNLPHLTLPTAVLVGTEDRLTPPVHAHGLAEALPHCVRLTELNGIGHMLPLEAPTTLATHIRDLLGGPPRGS